MAIRRSQLLKRRLDRLTRPLPALEHGDVPALHRARVATRRLRELLPMLELDPDVARKLGRRLRKITRRLGSVRELDVLLILIDELHVSRREHREALARVAVAVARKRDEARKKLFDRVPIAETWRLARKLERLVEELAEQEQSAGHLAARRWHWAVDVRLGRRAQRLRSALEDAGAVYLPERLHAVRIALKKLRYAAELAADIAGDKSTPDIRLLRRAQDTLGRLHDLQVLIDRVRQVQASLTPPSVALWRALDALVTSLDNECRQLHARYMRVRGELDAVGVRFVRSQVGAPDGDARRAAG
jgi:CHAD domain-containing protein